MADYTVEKIESGIATLRYSDGSWAEVVLSSDMTEEDVDDLALQFATKTGTKPSFLSAGDSRTAKAKAVPVDDRAEYIPAIVKVLKEHDEIYKTVIQMAKDAVNDLKL